MPTIQPSSTVLIAIDPSLRSTGYAVLRSEGGRTTSVDYGAIANGRQRSQTECLIRIFEGVRALVESHSPDACAMEGVIYVQSHRTAITLGAARSASILPVAMAGIPISEYAPRSVKQAVVGRGGADKSQVAFMVRALLKLTETPPPDAADALAIGLTHLSHTRPVAPRSDTRRRTL